MGWGEIMWTVTRNRTLQTLNSQPNFHTCPTTDILRRTHTKNCRVGKSENFFVLTSCFHNLLPWDLWMWKRNYSRRLNGCLFLFMIKGIESHICAPARLLQCICNENKNKYDSLACHCIPKRRKYLLSATRECHLWITNILHCIGQKLCLLKSSEIIWVFNICGSEHHAL